MLVIQIKPKISNDVMRPHSERIGRKQQSFYSFWTRVMWEGCSGVRTAGVADMEMQWPPRQSVRTGSTFG